MRVYLINPPANGGVRIVREGRCMLRQESWAAPWSPVSLALIAAVLLKEGWAAKLSDCIFEGMDIEQLERRVARFAPDLVLINTATASIESDLALCRRLKKIRPGFVTAAIGIHPTALPDDCLFMEPNLDFIIRGEPEITARELAAALSCRRPASGIKGLSYRRGGGIVHEPDRPPLENLDELPFPAWHLVYRERYRLPFSGKPFLLIATGRGCPHRCRFCADGAYYGKQLRVRSVKSVVDELAWVKDTFGIDEFLFWSESFTLDRAFCTGVAREILARGLAVSWVCNSRADHVDKEMLALFRRAGCWMIGYGVETGSQSVLDAMDKGITLRQIETAVTDARAAGLAVTGHCILGYPGETPETLQRTVDFTTRIPLDFIQYYCAVPFPGSALFQEAKKSGWLTGGPWSRFEQSFSVITTPQLTAAEVMRWRRKAYRAFYLRPRIARGVLKRMKSIAAAKNALRTIRDFLSWVRAKSPLRQSFPAEEKRG